MSEFLSGTPVELIQGRQTLGWFNRLPKPCHLNSQKNYYHDNVLKMPMAQGENALQSNKTHETVYVVDVVLYRTLS